MWRLCYDNIVQVWFACLITFVHYRQLIFKINDVCSNRSSLLLSCRHAHHVESHWNYAGGISTTYEAFFERYNVQIISSRIGYVWWFIIIIQPIHISLLGTYLLSQWNPLGCSYYHYIALYICTYIYMYMQVSFT